MKHLPLPALAASFLIGTACFATNALAQNVMETISQNPNLSTAAKLIKDAGLADTLSAPGPMTVFAPDNAAFGAVPAAQLAELSANKELLKSVLSYHVVPVSITTANAPNGMQKTATGQSISLYKSGTFLTVESALVTQADVKASNGVVQVIDAVLIPPKK
jgi:uncharacterized surface protein with fasciclin (FAS1) repeats